MKIDIDLRDPASFDHWTDVTIRFSDQDPNQHVNNTAFAEYCEAGRVDYLTKVRRNLDMPVMSALASVHIDYINQLHYPGTVQVGTRLTRLGGKVIATSEAVLVFFDYRANRSVAVPDPLRRAFEAGQSLTG